MALTLLRQIRAAGFEITAVLGDAEFGNNATLRRTLHRLHLPYALGICVDPDGLSRHPDGGSAAARSRDAAARRRVCRSPTGSRPHVHA